MGADSNRSISCFHEQFFQNVSSLSTWSLDVAFYKPGIGARGFGVFPKDIAKFGF
jgi:hypothetical protein